MSWHFPVSRSALWDRLVKGQPTVVTALEHRPHLQLDASLVDTLREHLQTTHEDTLILSGRIVDDTSVPLRLVIDQFDSSARISKNAESVERVSLRVRLENSAYASDDVVLELGSVLRRRFDLIEPLVATNYLALSIRLADNALDARCVMPATGFRLAPLSAPMIVPTALARYLTQPSSSSSSLAPLLADAPPQTGFLSMDQSHHLLLVLESDPLAYSLPLVGVWTKDTSNIHSHRVWAACVRYLHHTALKQRVTHQDDDAFLVLTISPDCHPIAYECRPMEYRCSSSSFDSLILCGTEPVVLETSQPCKLAFEPVSAAPPSSVAAAIPALVASTQPDSPARRACPVPSPSSTAPSGPSALDVSLADPDTITVAPMSPAALHAHLRAHSRLPVPVVSPPPPTKSLFPAVAVPSENTSRNNAFPPASPSAEHDDVAPPSTDYRSLIALQQHQIAYLQQQMEQLRVQLAQQVVAGASSEHSHETAVGSSASACDTEADTPVDDDAFFDRLIERFGECTSDTNDEDDHEDNDNVEVEQEGTVLCVPSSVTPSASLPSTVAPSTPRPSTVPAPAPPLSFASVNSSGVCADDSVRPAMYSPEKYISGCSSITDALHTHSFCSSVSSCGSSSTTVDAADSSLSVCHTVAFDDDDNESALADQISLRYLAPSSTVSVTPSASTSDLSFASYSYLSRHGLAPSSLSPIHESRSTVSSF